jgi:transforming growth factor-beta-induced protein
MKKVLNLLSITLLSITLFSCYNDDEGYGAGEPIFEEQTTFEFIQESENHTILANLLVSTGLDQTLDNGNFTIFAPTDEAFGNIDTSGLSNDEVTNILLNHVIQGVAESSILTTSYLSTQATDQLSGDENNLSIYVSVGPNVTLNGMSTVTQADTFASNGVVHVVDEVITIPDVTTFAQADPNFEILVHALTREDQSEQDYVGVLSSFDAPSPFTVFAPTNDAFASLLSELNGVEDPDDIDQEDLTAILNSHVIAGSNVTSANLPSGTVETLGDSFELDGTIITDQKGRTIEITVTDVQAGNGVLHVVNTVILPDLDFDFAETANLVQMTVGNSGASSYFVSEIIGNEAVTELNTDNSDWTLTEGTRYQLTITGASSHPFEIRDGSGNVLLSQDAEGSFESDPEVDFVDSGQQFEFTLTAALAAEIAQYICTRHASMSGNISVN